MQLLHLPTETELAHQCPDTFSRATDTAFQNTIVILSSSKDSLVARVKGGASSPYNVKVALGVDFASAVPTCSCVHCTNWCKHAMGLVSKVTDNGDSKVYEFSAIIGNR